MNDRSCHIFQGDIVTLAIKTYEKYMENSLGRPMEFSIYFYTDL